MVAYYDRMPTFLGYSEGDVGVIAGGGFTGYGGIVLHEPTEAEFHRIAHDPECESSEPKGAILGYDNVATITVSGLLKWTNRYLERAPKGRQDVREAGPVRIEIFDEPETRKYIEKQAKLFELLGIKFIS